LVHVDREVEKIVTVVQEIEKIIQVRAEEVRVEEIITVVEKPLVREVLKEI